MSNLEHVYMRALRCLYDTEKQLIAGLPAIRRAPIDAELSVMIREIEAQSISQASRLEEIFHLLYTVPRSEAAWVATALLREAWEAATSLEGDGGSEGCAAALLALKRYELTLYESLLRWSEKCELVEALPDIRRSIAQELMQSAMLSAFAFEGLPVHGATIFSAESASFH